MKRLISAFILLCFIITGIIGPWPIYAQGLVLPVPGEMVSLSPAYSPAVLKGIKLDPKNPFRFNFFVDTGDDVSLRTPAGGARPGTSVRRAPPAGVRNDTRLSDTRLKEESTKLIKYFLASLTIPEKDLWVNLSPYEKDRIVPPEFGQTEMGRDLLAQDYMLKQITASLIYPEGETGKEFWKKVYAQAQAKYGTTNIPINTFNKVWIVPEKAVVYENGGVAFVLENHLKVMLEQDYLSLQKHIGIASVPVAQAKDTNQLASQIVREIVIPALTKEVNEGKNFSQLRQVFYSLILATWYKKKVKDSILNKVYSDRKKTMGVDIYSDFVNKQTNKQTNPSLSLSGLQQPQVIDPQIIYQRYLQAFKKGVYNYIKEDIDLATQQPIPRKYFSGGVLCVAPNTNINYVGPDQKNYVLDSLYSGSFHITNVVGTFNPVMTGAGVGSTDGAMNAKMDGRLTQGASPDAIRTRFTEFSNRYGGKVAWLLILQELGLPEKLGFKIPPFVTFEEDFLRDIGSRYKKFGQEGIYKKIMVETNTNLEAGGRFVQNTFLKYVTTKSLESIILEIYLGNIQNAEGIRQRVKDLLDKELRNFLKYATEEEWIDFFLNLVKAPAIQRYIQNTVENGPLPSGFVYYEASNAFKQALENYFFYRTLPDEIKTGWAQRTKGLGINKIWRSSRHGEDSFEKSWAGFYMSHMTDSFREFYDLDRILQRPSDTVTDRYQDVSYSVFLQDYIWSEKSGIAFSNLEGHTTIETVVGEGQAAVKGSQNVIIDLNHETGNIEQVYQGFDLTDDRRAMLQWKGLYLHYTGFLDDNVAMDFINKLWQERTVNITSPDSRVHRSPLNMGKIERLRKVVQGVENALGFPVDVEFAFKGNDLIVVQTRPITGDFSKSIQPLPSFREADILARVPISIGHTGSEGIVGNIVGPLESSYVKNSERMIGGQRLVVKDTDSLLTEFGLDPTKVIVATSSPVNFWHQHALINCNYASRIYHHGIRFRENGTVVLGMRDLFAPRKYPRIKWDNVIKGEDLKKDEFRQWWGLKISEPVRIYSNDFRAVIVKADAKPIFKDHLIGDTSSGQITVRPSSSSQDGAMNAQPGDQAMTAKEELKGLTQALIEAFREKIITGVLNKHVGLGNEQILQTMYNLLSINNRLNQSLTNQEIDIIKENLDDLKLFMDDLPDLHKALKGFIERNPLNAVQEGRKTVQEGAYAPLVEAFLNFKEDFDQKYPRMLGLVNQLKPDGAMIIDLIQGQQIPDVLDTRNEDDIDSTLGVFGDYLHEGVVHNAQVRNIMVLAGNDVEAQEIDRLFPGRQMTFVNLHRQMLEPIEALKNAAKLSSNIKLYLADGTKLDPHIFPDGSYDLFFMNGVDVSAFHDSLEGKLIILGLIKNAVRILAKGGYLYSGMALANEILFQPFLKQGYLAHDPDNPGLYIRTQKVLPTPDGNADGAMTTDEVKEGIRQKIRQGHKVTVLLVDDEAVERNRFKSYILSINPNIDILEAEDGEDALEIIGPHKPDLIISDTSMDRMSGKMLFRETRCISNIPFILVSSITHINNEMDLPEQNLFIRGKDYERVVNTFIPKADGAMNSQGMKDANPVFTVKNFVPTLIKQKYVFIVTNSGLKLLLTLRQAPFQPGPVDGISYFWVDAFDVTKSTHPVRSIGRVDFVINKFPGMPTIASLTIPWRLSGKKEVEIKRPRLPDGYSIPDDADLDYFREKSVDGLWVDSDYRNSSQGGLGKDHIGATLFVAALGAARHFDAETIRIGAVGGSEGFYERFEARKVEDHHEIDLRDYEIKPSLRKNFPYKVLIGDDGIEGFEIVKDQPQRQSPEVPAAEDGAIETGANSQLTANSSNTASAAMNVRIPSTPMAKAVLDQVSGPYQHRDETVNLDYVYPGVFPVDQTKRELTGVLFKAVHEFKQEFEFQSFDPDKVIFQIAGSFSYLTDPETSRVYLPGVDDLDIFVFVPSWIAGEKRMRDYLERIITRKLTIMRDKPYRVLVFSQQGLINQENINDIPIPYRPDNIYLGNQDELLNVVTKAAAIPPYKIEVLREYSELYKLCNPKGAEKGNIGPASNNVTGYFPSTLLTQSSFFAPLTIVTFQKYFSSTLLTQSSLLPQPEYIKQLKILFHLAKMRGDIKASKRLFVLIKSSIAGSPIEEDLSNFKDEAKPDWDYAQLSNIQSEGKGLADGLTLKDAPLNAPKVMQSDTERFLYILEREFSGLLKTGEPLRILDLASGKHIFASRLLDLLNRKGIKAKIWANDDTDVTADSIAEAQRNGVTMLPVSFEKLQDELRKRNEPDKFHIIFINAPDFILRKDLKIFESLLDNNGFLSLRFNISEGGIKIGFPDKLRKEYWTVQELKELNAHPGLSDFPTSNAFKALLPPILAKPKGEPFREDYTVIANLALETGDSANPANAAMNSQGEPLGSKANGTRNQINDIRTMPLITDEYPLLAKGYSVGMDHVMEFSNEKGRDEMVRSLSHFPRIHNGICLGFGGFINLDIIAKRRSAFGLLADYHPKLAEFWKCLMKSLAHSDIDNYQGRARRQRFIEIFLENLHNDYPYSAGYIRNNQWGHDEGKLKIILSELLDDATSWLGSDEDFKFIRQMFANNCIQFIPLDVRDVQKYKDIKAWMDQHGFILDTAYLSNIYLVVDKMPLDQGHHYGGLVGNAFRRVYWQNLAYVGQKDTIFINADNPEFLLNATSILEAAKRSSYLKAREIFTQSGYLSSAAMNSQRKGTVSFNKAMNSQEEIKKMWNREKGIEPVWGENFNHETIDKILEMARLGEISYDKTKNSSFLFIYYRAVINAARKSGKYSHIPFDTLQKIFTEKTLDQIKYEFRTYLKDLFNSSEKEIVVKEFIEFLKFAGSLQFETEFYWYQRHKAWVEPDGMLDASIAFNKIFICLRTFVNLDPFFYRDFLETNKELFFSLRNIDLVWEKSRDVLEEIISYKFSSQPLSREAEWLKAFELKYKQSLDTFSLPFLSGPMQGLREEIQAQKVPDVKPKSLEPPKGVILEEMFRNSLALDSPPKNTESTKENRRGHGMMNASESPEAWRIVSLDGKTFDDILDASRQLKHSFDKHNDFRQRHTNTEEEDFYQYFLSLKREDFDEVFKEILSNRRSSHRMVVYSDTIKSLDDFIREASREDKDSLSKLSDFWVNLVQTESSTVSLANDNSPIVNKYLTLLQKEIAFWRVFQKRWSRPEVEATEKGRSLEDKNRAMRSPGGINMNPAQMSMQIKGQEEDFKFEWNGQTFDAAQVTGATFTIRSMTPVTNMLQILGLMDQNTKVKNS